MTEAPDEARGSVPSTFLFADLAGYTALTGGHGDEQAADLALEFALRADPSRTPLRRISAR